MMLSVECDFLITSSVLKIKPNTPKQSNLDIDKLKNQICSVMSTKHKYQYKQNKSIKSWLRILNIVRSFKFILKVRVGESIENAPLM
jgi:hypothetical protein